MTKPIKPGTVEPVQSDYEPTKAGVEKGFDLDISGSTVEEWMDVLGRALTETGDVR